MVHHSDIERDVRGHLVKIRKYQDLAREEAKSRLLQVSVEPYELVNSVPETSAIDGSYAPLYRSTSLWLVALRAVALRYSFTQEGPTYQLEGCEINEGAELVTTSKRVADDLSSFARELRDLTAARKGEAPRRMATLARIHREFELANVLAKKRRNSIILIDGTLTTPPVRRINELADGAVEYCRDNHNALVGVSKDSNANLFGSEATDEELLRGINRKELLYVKAPEPERTPLGPRGDIFFVKFHPEAPKWFRVDVISPHLETKELFGSIAQFARNQICPGYPLPLAEAHAMAVELRKYPRLYDDLLFKAGQELGFSFEEMAWGRTNVEGRRMDAFHAFLDILSKRGINT